MKSTTALQRSASMHQSTDYLSLIRLSLLVTISLSLTVGCQPKAPVERSNNGGISTDSTSEVPSNSDSADSGGDASDLVSPTSPTSGQGNSIYTPAPGEPSTVSSVFSDAATPPNFAPEVRPSGKTWLDSLPRDVWDIQYVGGQRVGYTHSHIDRSNALGDSFLRLEMDSLMQISRAGQPLDQRVQQTVLEDLNGQVVSVEATISDGADAQSTVNGQVLAGKMVLTERRGKQQGTKSIQWKPEYRGPFGIEQSLISRPMRSGEKRQFKMLVPVLNALGDVTMVAGKVVPVSLMDGKKENLLEVQATIQIESIALNQSIWVNNEGETIKTYSPIMNVVSFRVDRSTAESVASAARLDLLSTTSTTVGGDTSTIFSADQVTYNIALKNENPFDLFSQHTNQTITSKSPRTAAVTVYRIDPSNPISENIVQDPPTDLDRSPTPLIQSDAKPIVDLANKLIAAADLGAAPTDWEFAKALEKGIHTTISQKNFSRAFASALEVCQSPQGDCTEHAVLLAAVCRARGLPARVASGLIALPQETPPVMAYHMWTEVWLRDRWVPLDATRGEGGIGVNYLKVLESPLPDNNPYNALLPAIQVIGNVEIEVTPAGE